MKEQMLYKELARYYDSVYHFLDYEKHANKVMQAVDKYKTSRGRRLLDVACGTGKHIEIFKRRYTCTGIDVNDGMLAIARRIKGVRFEKADMIDFNMNKKFDVITCLFSSIGYVQTYANLKKTIQNFRNHLKEGGVILIEPWFTRETFNPGTVYLQTYEGDEKIARMSISRIVRGLSVVEMHYLIGDDRISHFREIHKLGLFDEARTLGIMKRSGLKPRLLKKGFKRKLYVCTHQ